MLDPVSLYFSTVLVSLTAGLVTYLFGRKYPEFRSVKDWGIATLVISIGTALVFARPIIQSDYVILASNAMIVAGMVLTLRTFKFYRRESTKDPVSLALIATAILMSLAWQNGYASEGLRSATVTAAISITLWRIVWLFASKPLPQARTAQRALIFTYSMYALLNSLRTIAAFAGSTSNVLDPSLIETIYVSGNTILWISATLCVIWMVVERQHGELKDMAMVDPLTKAMNRNAMVNAFEQEHARASRSNGTFALLLFDIDYFKQFNDTYGHLVGDQVLRSVVSNLKPIVRQNDSIGRYGGEEFAVLLSEVDKDIALKVAERARQRFEEHGVQVDQRSLELTVSCGVSCYPAHGKTWDELIAAADKALYKAKEEGRNQIIYAGDLPAEEIALDIEGDQQVVPA